MQTSPVLHVLPTHSGSTQTPFSQAVYGALMQMNSPLPHGGTHTPRLHTLLPSHRSPSSIMPSQSLSRASHFSSPISLIGLQTSAPLLSQVVRPSWQMPCAPGTSHGSPSPAHTRPSSRNTSSL